jgi:peroxiredoxin
MKTLLFNSKSRSKDKFLKIILWVIITVFSRPLAGAAYSPDQITINIQYKQAQANDSLMLVLDNIVHISSLELKTGAFKAKEKDGSFTFVVPVSDNCGYFDLFKTRTFTNTGSSLDEMEMLNRNFWEKGDSITIQLSHKETPTGIYSTCTFSGRGAEKYIARYKVDSVINSRIYYPGPVFDNKMQYHDIDGTMIDSALRVLELAKKGMTPLSYQVLKADILFVEGKGRFLSIVNYFKKNIRDAPDTLKNSFFTHCKAIFDKKNNYGISEEALAHSKIFLFYQCRKYMAESLLFKGHHDENWIYQNMKERLRGTIRDEIITIYFLNSKRSENTGRLYSDARCFISDANCINVLNELQETSLGNKFMDFSLPDVNGKMVSLSDFKGKTVVIDFWFRGCLGCTMFYKHALSDAEIKFKSNSQVVFISINVDKSRAVWIQGINSDQYTSPEAINVYTNGEGAQHPLMLKNNIAVVPCVVLLDKDRNIKYFNTDPLYTSQGLLSAITETN